MLETWWAWEVPLAISPGSYNILNSYNSTKYTYATQKHMYQNIWRLVNRGKQGKLDMGSVVMQAQWCNPEHTASQKRENSTLQVHSLWPHSCLRNQHSWTRDWGRDLRAKTKYIMVRTAVEALTARHKTQTSNLMAFPNGPDLTSSYSPSIRSMPRKEP